MAKQPVLYILWI